ncbi:hypothetical protein F5I97DRAFT_1926529 [Phlebopus sp. FC_14]|nr:hypothetical protein F5I97DRAFT_1926529 [Phlebopus sp. FC_14]
MSYFDGASPSDSNSSWQVQRGRGCTAIPDSASDRTSVRSGGDDLSGASGVITPAQAYVRAVKTGQVVDRTLQYTIERSQPERRTQPHTSPSLPVTNPSPNADRRASFAQRLYASAVANRSLTNPSILSVERPIAAPAITASGPLRSIYEPQHRRESRSPTSPDSQREAAQTFNAADFYNSGVSRYGNPTRTEPGLRRPPSAVSDSRTSTAPIPAPHSPSPSAYALPSVSQLQSSLRRDIQPCDPAVTSWQIQTVPAQTINPVRPRLDHDSPDVFEPPIPLFLPPSASCEPPAPESSSLHTPTDGARSRRPSLFAQAPVVEPPPTSPPPFDVREASRSMVGPAITPAAPQSSLNLTHSEPVHAISPQEASHEVVPLYSLVDETQPPPSFDEIQPTVSTAVPSGPSSIARPGTPLSTAVRDGSSGDSSRAISSLASAGSNNQAMDVKVPAMFTDLDVGSAGSSASGSLTPSVPERTYMSPPMNPQQIVPSYDMRFPSSFSAQGAVRGPSRTPSALSSRSAHNNPTHDPLLSLGAYSNHPVDQARHASVLALAEMRR